MPGFYIRADFCMEQADYVGHDIREIEDGSVKSAVACRLLCLQEEGCAFWTWFKDLNSCHLKSSDALLSKTNGVTTVGRYSGPKNCFMGPRR